MRASLWEVMLRRDFRGVICNPCVCDESRGSAARCSYLLSCWPLPGRFLLRFSRNPQLPVEQGKFILHKFEQPIGEETYRSRATAIPHDENRFQIHRPRKGCATRSLFPRRGPYSADIRNQGKERRGSRPSTKRSNARGIKFACANREKWSDAAKPKVVFHNCRLRSRDNPDANGALLGRDTAPPRSSRHCRAGAVKIEPRGQDTIHVGEKDETLDRYTVEGLIWGRETLWFDAKRNLVAAVTTDAEFDHFEAIREGYESSPRKIRRNRRARRHGRACRISKGIPAIARRRSRLSAAR